MGWFKESYRHSLASRGVSTRRYLAKRPDLFRVSESESERARRLNADFDRVILVDANKFKTAFEKGQGEKLAWAPHRMDKLRELDSVDSFPRVTENIRGVDVEDGRHRISLAAERGEKIPVTVREEQEDAIRKYAANKYFKFSTITEDGRNLGLSRGEDVVDVPIERAKVMRTLGEFGTRGPFGEGFDREDALEDYEKRAESYREQGFTIFPPKVIRLDNGSYHVESKVHRSQALLDKQMAETFVRLHQDDSSGGGSQEEIDRC